MIIRLFVLAGISLLAAAPAVGQAAASMEWRTDVPCTAGRTPVLRVASASVETSVPGCVRARCIALPDGRRVCACTGDTTRVIRVESGGRTEHDWPADYSLAGSAESLRAMTGDLDQDGRPELIVSEWMDVSNGLGIRYHRLSIFSGADPARPPLRVNVEDFAPDGSFARPREGGPCRLLATRWGQLRDERRGPGMYLIGQWMEYRGGHLLHDSTRPAVARRLLFSFRRHGVPGAPLAHLRDRRAQPWDPLPLNLPPLAGTRLRGTVAEVLGDTVALSVSPQRTLQFWALGEASPGPDGTSHTFWLVDGATGRPYPPGYASADRSWLRGEPVEIITYRDDGEAVHLIVVGPEPSAN